MSASNVEKEVEEFWRNRYAAGFLNKDPRQYAAAFALPCLIRAEGMPRRVFTTSEQLLAYVAEMLAKAEATTWVTSTIDSFRVRILDDEVAQVEVEASRLNATGQTIARLYGRYTVNKEAGEWKMVTIYGGFLKYER
jgi:hypothetical protein